MGLCLSALALSILIIHSLFFFCLSSVHLPHLVLLHPSLFRLSLYRPCLLLSNLICFHTSSVYTYSCCRQTSPHCCRPFLKSHFDSLIQTHLYLLMMDPCFLSYVLLSSSLFSSSFTWSPSPCKLYLSLHLVHVSVHFVLLLHHLPHSEPASSIITSV